ncbi:hypothetical protein K4F52_001294 [Lecanicillium sp. MT-2017a]|nr:hypothetical protein K4F52_001294 [Lecanicillium sp. MT-2017a]
MPRLPSKTSQNHIPLCLPQVSPIQPEHGHSRTAEAFTPTSAYTGHPQMLPSPSVPPTTSPTAAGGAFTMATFQQQSFYASATAPGAASQYMGEANRIFPQELQGQLPSSAPPATAPIPAVNVPHISCMRIANHGLGSINIQVPGDLTPEERKRRLALLAHELNWQKDNLPMLPVAHVEDQEPKKILDGEFILIQPDMSPEEREFAEAENKKRGELQGELNKERNREAALKSRNKKSTQLDDARTRFYEKASECNWLRVKLASLGVNALEAWGAVGDNVRKDMVEALQIPAEAKRKELEDEGDKKRRKRQREAAARQKEEAAQRKRKRSPSVDVDSDDEESEDEDSEDEDEGTGQFGETSAAPPRKRMATGPMRGTTAARGGRGTTATRGTGATRGTRGSKGTRGTRATKGTRATAAAVMDEPAPAAEAEFSSYGSSFVTANPTELSYPMLLNAQRASANLANANPESVNPAYVNPTYVNLGHFNPSNFPVEEMPPDPGL